MDYFSKIYYVKLVFEFYWGLLVYIMLNWIGIDLIIKGFGIKSFF